MRFFDHLKGAFYGLLRGLACSLGFLGLALLNYVGTALYFVNDLFNTLIGAPIAALLSLYRGLIVPLPDPLALLINTLELAVIHVPLIILQTLINFVGSTISMFCDFVWNTAINLIGAVLAPPASFINGSANGYENDTSNKTKRCTIFESLGFGCINQNLPVNQHLEVNKCDKAAGLIHGQNRFFANVRPEEAIESCSWTKQAYKVMI